MTRAWRGRTAGAALALLVAVVLGGLDAVRAAAPRPVRARHGMVVSAHRRASEAGIAILKQGGNAVDAAAATAFVAGVVEPYSAGLGGGGFMLVHLAATGDVLVLDYREVAPAGASATMYLDAEGNVLPDASLRGHRAVAVPGTVAGLAMAVERWGRLPLAEVLQPAIRAADEGFEADELFVAMCAEHLDLLAAWDATAAVFLDEHREPSAVGARVVQPDLAETLRRLAAEGPGAFYTGSIGAAIVADMAANGGLITAEDLAAYAPRSREPVRGTYRGLEIVTMPPPSSGGIHLVQMLNILEGYDLRASGWGSARTLHLMTETMRRAYADRAEHLGDPAFHDVPQEGLISRAYADALRATIRPDRASTSAEVRHGDPRAHVAPESDHTTHLCVIDDEGNAVSLTQTINTSFGSGIVVPGTGVLLNNEMDDFSAKPGAPNAYGLVGNDANAIAPGKIPLSSMTPTLVMKDGMVVLAVGSPGGSRIITTVLNVVLNVADHDMNVAEAVAAPRIHHQWRPDELWLEPWAAPREVVAALTALGHTIVQRATTHGNAMAIAVDAATGEFLGAADPRGVGAAVGY